MATAYTFNINYNGEDTNLTLAKELCNWTNFIGLLSEKLPTINNTGYSIHYFDREKNRKYLTDTNDFQQLITNLDDKKETQITIYHGQDNDNLINGWVFEPEFNESNRADQRQGDSNNTNNNGERADYATTFHNWGKLMDKHQVLIQNNLYINILTTRFAHALTVNPNLNVISSLDLWLTNFDQTENSSSPSSSCHRRGRTHRREFIASLPKDVGDYLMQMPHPGRRHHHHHHHHHHQRGPMPPFPAGGPFGFWSGLFNQPGALLSQEKECSNEKGKQTENSCPRSNNPFMPGDFPYGGGLMGMTKHWKKIMKMRMKDQYVQFLQQQIQQQSNHPYYNYNGSKGLDSTSSNDTSSSSSSSSSDDSSSSDSSDNENEKQSFRGKNHELSPRMQAKFWKSFAKQYRHEHAFDGHEHMKHHKKCHSRRHGRRHGRHHHPPPPPHQPNVPPCNFNHPPPPPFPGFEFGRQHPHPHHHHHHHHAPPNYMEEYFSKMNLSDSKKH